MKRTSWSQGLSVTADDASVVPLAGAVAVRLLADRVGLTEGLSAALTRRGFVPGHDRGQVWVDVATMLAAGGEAIADIDTLPHQTAVLGPVASPPTVWGAWMKPHRLRWLGSRGPAPRSGVTYGVCCRSCRRHRWPAPTWARWWCWMSTPRWSPRTRRRSGPGRRSRTGSGFHPIRVWCDCENGRAGSGVRSDPWCDWP